MTTPSLKDLRLELAGETGMSVSDVALSTILTVTKWPVDAFTADLGNPSEQIIAWVQEGAIGVLTALNNFENPDLTVVVRPARSVRSVRFEPTLLDRGIRSVVQQTMTIHFEDGEPITVYEGKYANDHYREHFRGFVRAVVKAI